MELIPVLFIAGLAAYFGLKKWQAHSRRHLPPTDDERAALEKQKSWLEERRLLAEKQNWDSHSRENLESALSEIERRLKIGTAP